MSNDVRMNQLHNFADYFFHRDLDEQHQIIRSSHAAGSLLGFIAVLNVPQLQMASMLKVFCKLYPAQLYVSL